MMHPPHIRATIVLFLAILALSAVTMIWLFWHYPRVTGIATVIVLAGLYISARLARSMDTELPDLERRERQN